MLYQYTANRFLGSLYFEEVESFYYNLALHYTYNVQL